MEKKKLLKRLSALGFAMYECRLYCDTHPNDTEALQMLNDYKSKYEAVKAEFEKQYGPLTLNGFNQKAYAFRGPRLIFTPCLNKFCFAKFIVNNLISLATKQYTVLFLPNSLVNLEPRVSCASHNSLLSKSVVR